eukprot:12889984-Ditylum_brightwellii.AAC.1
MHENKSSTNEANSVPIGVTEKGQYVFHDAVDTSCIKCWTCGVLLQNQLDADASDMNNSEDEDPANNLITQPQDKPPPLTLSSSTGHTPKHKYGNYAIHGHPLLKVTTCSACVDVAYAVEDDARNLIYLRESKQNGDV